ncbi:MAG: glycoside hydrolase family 97 catalytic domain-containing protein, partial [Fulvivirga sp.]
NTDVTKTVPSLNMQRVCDYAKQKGVGIHVWVHWKAIYPKLEEALAQFEKWGINGMMVDFLDRDDQEMVKIQEEILQKAAEHKLYIQFHGAFKPTGLHRTYPNEFTREGTHNYEQNKWMKKGVSPDHDLDIVFTRLLAGAADYHLGGFRAVPEAEFKTQYTRPLMIGTRCHMLAMYIVLESYLASLCDYPKAYEGEPGFDFLKEIPTTWDETIVPDGEVGEYVTFVRRKGENWYVGSLNNSEQRTIKVALDFLPAGNYTAEIYTDAPDVAQNPNHLTKKTQNVNRDEVLTISLAAGGGQVMRLIKQ